METLNLESISNTQIVKDILGSQEFFLELFNSQKNCLQFDKLFIDKRHCLETSNLIDDYISKLEKTSAFLFSINKDFVSLLGLLHHIFQDENNNYLKKKKYIFWKFLQGYQKFDKNLYHQILKAENLSEVRKGNESQGESNLIKLINNSIDEILLNTFIEDEDKLTNYKKEFEKNADYKFVYKNFTRHESEFKEFTELKQVFYILLFFDIYSGFLHFINKSELNEDEKMIVERISYFILRILHNVIGTYRFGSYFDDLKDHAFRIFDNQSYELTKTALNKNVPTDKWIEKIEEKLTEIVKQIPEKVTILKRRKSVYSSCLKALNYNVPVEELWDLYALRLIIDSDEDSYCYELVDKIQDVFTPWANPKGNTDYIVNPKSNGYQSLHIVIENDDKKLLEIQVRTKKMNYVAEFGTASHQIYKDIGKTSFDLNPLAQKGKKILQDVLSKKNLSMNDFVKHIGIGLDIIPIEHYFEEIAKGKYDAQNLAENILESRRKDNERRHIK